MEVYGGIFHLEVKTMNFVRNPGRVAGLWYLLLTLAGPLSLIYIPNKLYDFDHPAVTVHNIATHVLLFRLGIVTDLLGALILVYLTLAFYRLFKGVDEGLAVQVVIFGGVMPALLYFVNVVPEAGALALIQKADFLAAFSGPQRDALVVLLLRLHSMQNTAAELLWGVWLLPLGMLVYRSRFLPRFLGVWLGINGVAYVALCLLGELAPQYAGKGFLIAQPALLGEMVLMLWLVIRGSRPQAALRID
jgi:hypothetical protein